MYGQRTEPLFVDSGELGAPNKAIEKYTSDTLIRAILEKWELKVPNHETSEKTLAYWTTINEATRKEFLDLFNSNHSKVKTILGDAVCKWILSDLENHKTRSELSQYRIIVNRLSKESAIDESAKEVLLQEIETYMNGGLPETRLEIMQESRQTNNEPLWNFFHLFLSPLAYFFPFSSEHHCSSDNNLYCSDSRYPLHLFLRRRTAKSRLETSKSVERTERRKLNRNRILCSNSRDRRTLSILFDEDFEEESRETPSPPRSPIPVRRRRSSNKMLHSE